MTARGLGRCVDGCGRVPRSRGRVWVVGRRAIECLGQEARERVDVLRRYGVDAELKVVDVLAEGVAEHLERGMWVHARVGDAECLLEAFEHAAAVADVGRVVGGGLPPQVACHEHGRGLLRPLEELGRVQGGLGREGLVVVCAKDAGLVQCADHEANRLELGARVGQALFKDGECVHKHVVCHVFDACLVSDFRREEKEAHTQLGRLDGMVLRGDQLVHELEESADLALPS